MKVLITGFDPFGGETINPAYEAVKRLPDQIDGHDIIKLEVPTVFNASVEAVQQAIDAHAPDIVICVGQSGGKSAITPEVVAINLEEARIPDNAGNQPSGKKIAEDGDTAYFATLPVKAMVKAMLEAGIPAQLSYSAGTYVCNHLFYGVMHHIASNKLDIRGGFIHIPYMFEQVLDKAGTAAMPLDMMTKALLITIEACIENDEDIFYQAGEIY